MRMRYDLATNFDDELIERVADFGIVKSVYGKLDKDIVGGGRPSLVLPKISRKQLRKHIETAHKYGIEFNYLLNASCMDNREFIGPSHKEIMKLVREIREDGADAVTVSSPAFLKMVKEQFPELKISASDYLEINTLDKMKHYENLGASQITLRHNFCRDFELLEKALKIANKETDLRLIANNICLHNCPYHSGHANLMAHSSQLNHESEGSVIDPYTIFCGLQKIKNPAELLMAEWIRPEDVHYYEELCDKTGNSNLVLKLTDRARTTDWLVNVVKAYSEKSYDGNLMDIVNYIGNRGGYAQVHKWPMIKGALTGKIGLGVLKLKKATFLLEVYLNNKDLNGFMEHFIKNPCRDKTCYTDDKSYGECKHCYNLAKKLVKMDESKKEEAISFTEDFVHSITSGEIF